MPLQPHFKFHARRHEYHGPSQPAAAPHLYDITAYTISKRGRRRHSPLVVSAKPMQKCDIYPPRLFRLPEKDDDGRDAGDTTRGDTAADDFRRPRGGIFDNYYYFFWRPHARGFQLTPAQRAAKK